ncbi:hypothetical protein ACW6QP_05395 [Salegentibacter sp. HM20]
MTRTGICHFDQREKSNLSKLFVGSGCGSSGFGIGGLGIGGFGIGGFGIGGFGIG